jgi:hypothetical protein
MLCTNADSRPNSAKLRYIVPIGKSIFQFSARPLLVTKSALGDPQLVGLECVRELSGFNVSVELRRRVIATVAKTLFLLGLMALIMCASLYFPATLVKEKVTVAITGALSEAVLLSSINLQLGNVGYVIAVECGFYVFFILCLHDSEVLAALKHEPVSGIVPMQAHPVSIVHPEPTCCSRSLHRAQIRRPPFVPVASL